MLIAHDGRHRFEQSQAVESGSFESAPDGVLTDAELFADLAIRLTATPLLDHLGLDCWRQGVWAGFRT